MKKIYTIFEDQTIAESTIHRCFARFRKGNFDLEDCKHFSRAAVIDDEQIEAPMKNNPGHTTRNIIDILHISHKYCKVFETTWMHKMLMIFGCHMI